MIGNVPAAPAQACRSVSGRRRRTRDGRGCGSRPCDGVVEGLRVVRVLKDAFPDLKINVQDMFSVGDKVTVLVHFQGTHQGAFQQFEATGRQVSYRSIEVYRIEGDKIAEEWVAPDMLSLMQQISTGR
ncbi:ester cyclase [Streptomyces lunaelactis]|uniref:ester cyclase n=1 Tax=Streptomyces lunaelactis TaxID=1535768 RepID=UPI00158514A7|nr:ester cyclase [Streptomyces lunaelactis]NUK51584.1 ester cyclase [Streptomyces lunaelactis]NUK63899.1 ester cyclase [Streptomyces lunaelactis]